LTGFSISSTTGISSFEQLRLGGVQAAAVPEPSTWALMLLGFGGMGLAMRRNRRRSVAQLAQMA
ncbi:MAG TPA: PEPxxWA-CTERM sorting domain-containing protein, partial [Sphingomicrobium sp.]|nr:PEPxxWA-CTERM sorting domain-containing protein [Sphingomicrobium sp.]